MASPVTSEAYVATIEHVLQDRTVVGKSSAGLSATFILLGSLYLTELQYQVSSLLVCSMSLVAPILYCISLANLIQCEA